MRVLIINPNSSPAMSAVIETAARSALQKNSISMQVTVVGLPNSSPLINSSLEDVEAAYHTVCKVRESEGEYDAFVIACHSDPATDALSTLTSKPVMGIGFASLYTALLFGQKITVFGISEASIERKYALIRRYGFDASRFTVIPTHYSENMNRQDVADCLIKAGRCALEKYESDAFVLGCAGMAVAAAETRDILHKPVLEGVEEALFLLEKITRQR